MTFISAIRPGRRWAPVLLATLFAASAAGAAEQSPPAPGAGAAAHSDAPAADTQAATQESDVAAYCRNTADATAEARIAWQTWKLLALQDSLRQQIDALERKRAQFQEWVEKRNKILAAVEDHVVSIYGKMRPDAAAEQLATLDEEIAVAVLSRLKPRDASAILNEMEPARAAQLAQSMASLTNAKLGEGS
ncbi:flagellar motility protein MotE (MotC chaperone) [Breoghania corrubedonensis]|uniref:Flagellar motility protein MotE (MotC chaperone) n=1 Tax=Breoghania corrubedonensis TaxID=665038 RepID=A0A2T5V8T7_9HYPH|nr:MotE family protein [Breoghania corrubedonensis]PTW60151.1 flagellar motility protein MotE (MotC chaperone) [Breoghania corrubedonensis]